MKKILIALLLLIHLGYAYSFESQGFAKYREVDDAISANCTQQCMIIGPLFIGNDFFNIRGNVKGNGNMVLGFMVGNQIFPFLQQKIEGERELIMSGDFTSVPQISAIPSDANIVLYIQGNVELSNIIFELGSRGVFEKIKSGIRSASQYTPYSPRTINFLEFPLWNGKYIVQIFFPWLFILISIFIVLFYLLDKKIKRNIIFLGGFFIAFFWLVVDIFMFIQQKKLYEENIYKKSPLEKTRYGGQTAEVEYLSYIKQIIPAGSSVYIYAPYPYDFELQYRLYPHIRIGTISNSNYIIWYNPYGSQNIFNYIDPIISMTNVKIGGVEYPLIKNNIYSPQGGVLQIK